jgi:hypothetical protein
LLLVAAKRPENVIEGHITWTDYRPAEHPHHVRIFHHKTDLPVWLPLSDDDGPFYPHLEVCIANLRRLGTPIVLKESERGPGRRYSLSYARRRVREARRAAGLPEHVTLDACRHGGLTALGDAGATAFEIRAMSAHKTLAGVHTKTQWIEEETYPDQRNEIRRFVGMSEAQVVGMGVFDPGLFRASRCPKSLLRLIFMHWWV